MNVAQISKWNLHEMPQWNLEKKGLFQVCSPKLAASFNFQAKSNTTYHKYRLVSVFKPTCYSSCKTSQVPLIFGISHLDRGGKN